MRPQPAHELEFQRTNLALGRPVDVESLIDIAEDAIHALEDGEASQEARKEAQEATKRSMRSAKMGQDFVTALGVLAKTVESACNELRDDRLSKPRRTRLANTLDNAAKRAQEVVKSYHGDEQRRIGVEWQQQKEAS